MFLGSGFVGLVVVALVRSLGRPRAAFGASWTSFKRFVIVCGVTPKILAALDLLPPHSFTVWIVRLTSSGDTWRGMGLLFIRASKNDRLFMSKTVFEFGEKYYKS